MNIITMSANFGKTKKLVLSTSKNWKKALIVCATEEKKIEIKNIAQELGIFINEPITFQELDTVKITHKNYELYIDDIDLYFKNLTGLEINTITFTPNSLGVIKPRLL